MTISVWITRTQPSADESAEVWRAAGFAPLILPLLEVRTVAHKALPPETVVIFTSKNGVDHYVGVGHRAICVGDATAARARDAGYRNVVSVDGTSADITAWILANLPKTQPICHVSGQHVRGSITEDLRASGYPATRLITYRSHIVNVWPDDVPEIVALYSPLAAKAFAISAADRDVQDMTALCISAATAAELACLALRDIRIAARPREDALIAST